MKLKVVNLIIVLVFCNVLSYGQFTVLLVNGKSLNSSSISIKDDPVSLVVDNESQSVSKTEILCIIPEGKKSYTFSSRNNKKVKIKKRFISNDYQGTDIARIFAFKYYKNTDDPGELYRANSASTISEEEFIYAFNKQHKKITTGKVAGIVILSISVGMLVTTVNEIISLNNY